MSKRGKIFLISFILLVISVLSVSTLVLPFPKEEFSDGFSALRVSKDIEYISKEPHSIEHYLERERVRSYLAARLQKIGYITEVEYYDTIGNVYAKLPPISNKTDDVQYVLLMAHLDSRYALNVNGKIHYSRGAADDGYGLGVILELANNLLGFREEWVQGVKIIFTDAEETNLGGIKMAMSERSDFFSDVGLIINVEARGVRGPALLFESSPKNDRLINLYSNAKYPYGYSLTSFVYNILPNYTDFSLIKEKFSGLNFAVIDNLDYYHTEFDNFNNISLNSIQHYGEQLLPILNSYLTDNRYSDNQFLKGETDSVYFTIPFLGIVIFTTTGFLTLFVLIILMLLANIVYLFVLRKISLIRVLKCLLVLLLILTIVGVGSYFGSRILAVLNGVSYKFIGLAHLKYDVLYSTSLLIITIVLIISIYNYLRFKGFFKLSEFAIAAEVLLASLSIISYLIAGENFFVLLPLIFSMISRTVSTYKTGWILVTLFASITVFTIVPFIYALYIALFTGALAVPLILVSIMLFVLIPAIDSVTTKLAL